MKNITKEEFLKNEKIIKSALNFLISEGFMISTHFEYRSGNCSLESNEILEYFKNKDSYLAERHSLGLTKNEYLQAIKIMRGHDNKMVSRCCALTTKKRRCKNSVLIARRNNIHCEEDIIRYLGKTFNETGSLCDLHEEKLNLGSNIDILPIKHYETSQYD